MKQLVLDIETISPSDEEMQIELDMIKPTANIKDPKKKELNVQAKKDDAQRRSCLLDGSKIGCVGMMSDDFIVCFTSYKVSKECFDTMKRIGVILFPFTSEHLMLTGLSEFISDKEEYEIVTFNGMNFDLPKIRFRYARNSIEIPKQFGRYIKHNDLMRTYLKYYSQSSNYYVSFNEVARRIGVLPEGKCVSGKNFQSLIDNGETLLATLYNVFDLCITKSIALRLNV